MPYKLEEYSGDQLAELLDKLRMVEHTTKDANTYVLTEVEYWEFLNMRYQQYQLQPATNSTLGGIIVGDGLKIAVDGLLSTFIKNASNIPVEDKNNNFVGENVEDVLTELYKMILSLRLKIDGRDLLLILGDKELSRVTLNLEIEQDTWSISKSLTNCSASNMDDSVIKGSSYNCVITANTGYTLSNIVVTMNGVDVTSTVVTDNHIYISEVTGNVRITAGASLSAYTVTNILTNCTNSNTAMAVSRGDQYSATITANSGYDMGAIQVVMGSTDITSSAVSGNTIHITNVTDNITITANATKTYKMYTITNKMSNCHNSSNLTQVMEGSNYSCVVVPESDFEITRILVYMGDQLLANAVTGRTINIIDVSGDIVIIGEANRQSISCTSVDIIYYDETTDNAYTINVPNTKGKICAEIQPANTTDKITWESSDSEIFTLEYDDSDNSVVSSANKMLAYARVIPHKNGVGYITCRCGNASDRCKVIVFVREWSESTTPTYYNVTLNLENCHAASGNTGIAKGARYANTITADSGYQLNEAEVITTMGGEIVYRGTDIDIREVTGDIVITATAKRKAMTYTVTYNLKNCTADPKPSTVKSTDEYFHTTISPKKGYWLGGNPSATPNTPFNVTATMENGRSEYIGISGMPEHIDINISPITGNIYVSATAYKQ